MNQTIFKTKLTEIEKILFKYQTYNPGLYAGNAGLILFFCYIIMYFTAILALKKGIY